MVGELLKLWCPHASSEVDVCNFLLLVRIFDIIQLGVEQPLGESLKTKKLKRISYVFELFEIDH